MLVNIARARKLAQLVLENEGGWSDNPHDSGGQTKYGITKATATRHGLDVRFLTRNQALDIFVKDYWSFDWVPDDRLAAKLFDISVNSGPQSAIEILQQALLLLGHKIDVDAIVGPQTRMMTSNALRNDAEALLVSISYEHMDRYVRLVISRSSQREFIRGWMKRGWKVYDI